MSVSSLVFVTIVVLIVDGIRITVRGAAAIDDRMGIAVYLICIFRKIRVIATRTDAEV